MKLIASAWVIFAEKCGSSVEKSHFLQQALLASSQPSLMLHTSCRFAGPLQAAHISFQPHLFVDNDNTPPETIAAAVDGVAKEVQATRVVVARSNKVGLELHLFSGTGMDRPQI